MEYCSYCKEKVRIKFVETGFRVYPLFCVHIRPDGKICCGSERFLVANYV